MTREFALYHLVKVRDHIHGRALVQIYKVIH